MQIYLAAPQNIGQRLSMFVDCTCNHSHLHFLKKSGGVCTRPIWLSRRTRDEVGLPMGAGSRVAEDLRLPGSWHGATRGSALSRSKVRVHSPNCRKERCFILTAIVESMRGVGAPQRQSPSSFRRQEPRVRHNPAARRNLDVDCKHFRTGLGQTNPREDR